MKPLSLLKSLINEVIKESFELSGNIKVVEPVSLKMADMDGSDTFSPGDTFTVVRVVGGTHYEVQSHASKRKYLIGKLQARNVFAQDKQTTRKPVPRNLRGRKAF